MRSTLRTFSLFNTRLLVSLVVLFSAAVAVTSTVSITVSKASTMYCIGADYVNGGMTFVSCGSSAGNYIAHCDGEQYPNPDGTTSGACTVYTGELNQAIADSVCDSGGSNIDPNACRHGY